MNFKRGVFFPFHLKDNLFMPFIVFQAILASLNVGNDEWSMLKDNINIVLDRKPRNV